MSDSVIISRSNALIKKIRKLGDKKYRYAFGEYIAEGERWVRDALSRCPENVLHVVCSQSSMFEHADTVVADDLFAEISDTEHSQGVLAIMRMPAPTEKLQSSHCLFLDRVRDPGNMGTIIRTACAAGYEDIILRDCVDAYNPKVIRSCMTGILGVRFHYAQDIENIKSAGYTTFAATLDGKDIFLSNTTSKKLCLVIGNEADGIASDIISACDCKVTIPMRANMESLNAAVSAGILMYQLKYNNRSK